MAIMLQWVYLQDDFTLAFAVINSSEITLQNVDNSNLFILGCILKHNLLFCIQFFENAIILVHARTILGRQYPRRPGAGLPQPFDTS